MIEGLLSLGWLRLGVGAAVVVVAILSAGHALIWKRDPRSALGWVVVCLWVPCFGALSYWLFGINRVATRARELSLEREGRRRESDSEPLPSSIAEAIVEDSPLARVSAAVTGLPLTVGNEAEALHDGEEAFPRMLAAIAEARRTVFLCTYIFDTDSTGNLFLEALAAAMGRGVEVRVILDGYGELYSWPRMRRRLRRRGVPVARFHPPRLFPPTLQINLRTHRKILTVDGRIAFTGGMNLGDRHLTAEKDNPDRVTDVHFGLEGPIARQLENVFRHDWFFLTGEDLPGTMPEARTEAPAGNALCRAILDGPDENLEKLQLVLLGAMSTAQKRLVLMTPYFLPPRELIAALIAAAVRGVEVVIILPGKNNLPYVHWATQKMLWELLQREIRVFYQPPPFVHSKLCLVDDDYALIGSANLDPRSLRLNFELNVEIYDLPLATHLARHVDEVLSLSREVSLEEMDARSIPVRLRDAICWIFSPYL